MPQDLLPFLFRASAITTIGTAVLACSDSESVANPPISSGPEGGIDQGAPDVQNGPDVALDCEPMAWYGPMGCADDADCATELGPGYVCDKTAGYTDPCFGFVPWPVCSRVDGGVPDATTDEPMTHYGPMPVDSGVPDATTDEPMTHYGPMPADSGQNG
jgi:hypothetical protein